MLGISSSWGIKYDQVDHIGDQMNIEYSLDFIIMNTSFRWTWTIYVHQSQSWCQCLRKKILIYKNFHLSPFLSIQHLLGVPPYIFHDLWYLWSLRLHLESTPWGPDHSCPENTSLSAKVSKILPRGTTTGFQGRNQGITGRFLGKSKVEIYQNLPYGSHATLQSLIPSGRH